MAGNRLLSVVRGRGQALDSWPRWVRDWIEGGDRDRTYRAACLQVKKISTVRYGFCGEKELRRTVVAETLGGRADLYGRISICAGIPIDPTHQRSGQWYHTCSMHDETTSSWRCSIASQSVPRVGIAAINRVFPSRSEWPWEMHDDSGCREIVQRHPYRKVDPCCVAYRMRVAISNFQPKEGKRRVDRRGKESS